MCESLEHDLCMTFTTLMQYGMMDTIHDLHWERGMDGSVTSYEGMVHAVMIMRLLLALAFGSCFLCSTVSRDNWLDGRRWQMVLMGAQDKRMRKNKKWINGRSLLQHFI